MALPLFLLLLFLLSLHLMVSPSSGQEGGGGTSHHFIPTTTPWSYSVGVTYNLSLPNLPSPTLVAKAIADRHIPRVRLIDPDPAAISAFSKVDVDVYISIDDTDRLVSFANDNSSASDYLSSHVVPALPSLNLSAITVGNGILIFNRNLSRLVLPAVSRMYNACQSLGLTNVTVTSAHTGHLVTRYFPPSNADVDSASFKYLSELLKFYNSTGGPFMIDVFPYATYASSSLRGLNLEFATFKAKTDRQKLEDPGTIVMYDNLFQVMVDSIVAIISTVGYHMMPINIVATGWPWLEGDPPGGGPARDYNQGIIDTVNTMAGTPLRRLFPGPKVYIMGLFDEGYRGNDPHNGSFALWNSTSTLEERYALRFENGATPGGGGGSGFACFVAPLLAAWTLLSRTR